jgi:hypothetical protein
MLRVISRSSFLRACLFGSGCLLAACGSDDSKSKNAEPDGGDARSSGGAGGGNQTGGGGTGNRSAGTGGSSGKSATGGKNAGGANPNAGGTNPGAGDSKAGGGNGGSFMPPISVVDPPGGGTPAPAGTTDLPLSKADALPSVVKVVPNRGSVVLILPKVTGARDFRVFAVENGVKVTVGGDNREHIDGATITCAGLRQRNQCDEGEILPVKYNNETLDAAKCDPPGVMDRKPNVPTQLMQTLEVDGVGKDVTFVVEAIDRQCPFPGLFGSKHRDIMVVPVDGPTVNATVNGKAYTLKHWPDAFPVRTEAEIRQAYGSMILNGQGPNLPVTDLSSPNFPESPYVRVGLPAPADDPIVLARSVIKVSSTGTATLPEGFKDTDYFDDFEDSTDQPKFVRNTDPTGTLVGVPVNVLANKKWIFYDVGAYEDAARGFSDMFVDRGQINMLMGDPSQDAMSLQAMYPKRPAHLPDAPDQYLHITYSAQRIETSRRYENLVLCGSDTAGQVYDGEFLKAAPLPRPGFMEKENARRSTPLGWECIYFVPRGGGFNPTPGGEIPNTHSDSLLRVTVMKKQPLPANGAAYDSEVLSDYTVSMGPSADVFPNTWVRQIDSQGKMIGPWLDDHINVWQKTRFDVFLRRDRFITYVDGEQRLCGNLSEAPLKMVEGAIGFWHVLYHSSAEFYEVRTGSGAPYTGMHHVLHNEPFADQRSWDNVGFRENVAAPANFDASRCR